MSKTVTSENNSEVDTIPSSIADKYDTAQQNNTAISFEIPYLKKPISCLSFGSPTAQLSLIFTQGAFGQLSSPGVVNFAEGFSESKRNICFHGRGNLTSRTNMFKTVVEHHQCSVLGGRSMGARTAIATAKEVDDVKALILVSYPLRGDKGDLRDQLLLDIDEGIDVLFVIGDRDPMCDLKELATVRKQMKAKTWIVVVNDANHGMEMRPSKATSAMGKMMGRVAARWIDERNEKLTNCNLHWDNDQDGVVVGPWND